MTNDTAVQHDGWDREDYDAVRDEVPALVTATQSLLRITHTARPAFFDAFNVLHKALPLIREASQVDDEFKVNHAVATEFTKLTKLVQELRRFTRGDLVGSAMSLVELEPDLAVLFDREQLRQSDADKLQRLRDELAQKLAELAEAVAQSSPDEGDEDGEDEGAGSAIGDLEAEIEA